MYRFVRQIKIKTKNHLNHFWKKIIIREYKFIVQIFLRQMSPLAHIFKAKECCLLYHYGKETSKYFKRLLVTQNISNQFSSMLWLII